MDSSNPHIRDADTGDFPTAVLQRSREVPVVVDFWAEWCGPCKVLGPALEKVTAEHGGAFELVKVDVDRNPQLAGQFGVQGIPTVIAFQDGAPISRFTGAIPESSIREWVAQFVPSELDLLVDSARSAALAGDGRRAEEIYLSVLDAIPDHAEAGVGLAGLLIARGETQDALLVLERLAPTAEVDRLKAAARLSASRDDDIPQLEVALEADPDDEQSRYELGLALAARSEFEPALDNLLRLVRTKGKKMDDARLAMLDVFGLLGDDHPLTQLYRKQLASALF